MRLLIAPVALAALAACSSEAPSKPAVTDSVGICLCGPYVRPASAALNAGDRIQFTVVGWPGYTEFRWRSSNPAIAVVDSMTGWTTALSPGSATILAAAVKDRTVQGAAAVMVGGSVGSMETPRIEAVNEVATGMPANLSALSGDVDVLVSYANPKAGDVVSLVISNGSRDTSVAKVGLDSGSKHFTLRWATAARVGAVPTFPNGPYLFSVALATSGQTVTSARNNAIVVNP